MRAHQLLIVHNEAIEYKMDIGWYLKNIKLKSIFFALIIRKVFTQILHLLLPQSLHYSFVQLCPTSISISMSFLNSEIWDLRWRSQASPRQVQRRLLERNVGQSSPAVNTATAEETLMIDIAAKFVQDVIEKARTEATAKMNSETLVITSYFEWRDSETLFFLGTNRTGWKKWEKEKARSWVIQSLF